MQNRILAAIAEIESAKRARAVVPSYALCQEVCGRLRLEKSVLLSELEKMQGVGVVFGIGSTINDTYILLQPIEKYM